MVDKTDFGAANALLGELRTVTMAIDIFDADGRIVNMTLASAQDQVPPLMITVSTATMTYPSQMVEAIKGFLVQREQDIRAELGSLGVTGVAETMPRSVKGAKI